MSAQSQKFAHSVIGVYYRRVAVVWVGKGMENLDITIALVFSIIKIHHSKHHSKILVQTFLLLVQWMKNILIYVDPCWAAFCCIRLMNVQYWYRSLEVNSRFWCLSRKESKPTSSDDTHGFSYWERILVVNIMPTTIGFFWKYLYPLTKKESYTQTDGAIVTTSFYFLFGGRGENNGICLWMNILY